MNAILPLCRKAGARSLVLHNIRNVPPPPTVMVRAFHVGRPVRGLDEFFDEKKPNETVTTGRAWTVADVRRKSFDDIHKLWFILYKENNLLLSEREKARRNIRPVLAIDEHRYIKVKRSMAAIKQVLGERQRINDMLKRTEATDNKTSS